MKMSGQIGSQPRLLISRRAPAPGESPCVSVDGEIVAGALSDTNEAGFIRSVMRDSSSA